MHKGSDPICSSQLPYQPEYKPNPNGSANVSAKATGTNYWGPVVPKGAPTMLHMFLPLSAVSLSVYCAN